jgi:hypothetical protein
MASAIETGTVGREGIVGAMSGIAPPVAAMVMGGDIAAVVAIITAGAVAAATTMAGGIIALVVIYCLRPIRGGRLGLAASLCGQLDLYCPHPIKRPYAPASKRAAPRWRLCQVSDRS